MTKKERDIAETTDVEETTEHDTDIAAVAKNLTDFMTDGGRSREPTEKGTGSIGRRGYLRAVGAAAATGLGVGALTTSAAAQETLTENTQTEHDGHFVSFWTDTPDSVSMTLEDGGYSVDWENTGNFVVGKGWNPGSRRTVEYDATYNPTENSYLCLYGWTTDPLVEYYIIESHGEYRPGNESHGSHQSDGGTYDLYTSERIEQPSIVGTATFTQYWSIRQSQRTSGTITIGNHFDAWESAGLPLGDHDYQIMATEAYNYSGANSASVTISEADDSGTGGDTGDDHDDHDDTGDTGGDDTDGDVSAWDAGEIYTEGDRVSYDGLQWEAQWWTQNEEPGSREYGPWEEIGADAGDGDTGSDDSSDDTGGDDDTGDDTGDDDTGDDTGGSSGDASTWDSSEIYTEGDRVEYGGSTWEAQWWTQNQEPGASQWGPWEEV